MLVSCSLMYLPVCVCVCVRERDCVCCACEARTNALKKKLIKVMEKNAMAAEPH